MSFLVKGTEQGSSWLEQVTGEPTICFCKSLLSEALGKAQNRQAAPLRLTEAHHALLNYISSLKSSGIRQQPTQLTQLTQQDRHFMSGKGVLKAHSAVLKGNT